MDVLHPFLTFSIFRGEIGLRFLIIERVSLFEVELDELRKLSLRQNSISVFVNLIKQRIELVPLVKLSPIFLNNFGKLVNEFPGFVPLEVSILVKVKLVPHEIDTSAELGFVVGQVVRKRSLVSFRRVQVPPRRR